MAMMICTHKVIFPKLNDELNKGNHIGGRYDEKDQGGSDRPTAEKTG